MRLASLAYLGTAVSLVVSLWQPTVAFFGYGISIAMYYQLTRVLVIEAAPMSLRGRVSAAMTAPTKLVAVAGGALAPHLVPHRAELHVVAATVAMACAATVFVRRAGQTRLVPTS